MSIALSQRLAATRPLRPSIPDEPFASFDALCRSLRTAAREHAALWRESIASALMARRAGACDALITAALLHRLGDLVVPVHADGAVPRSSSGVAHRGADLLGDLFPPLVTEPIRLHPSARRYLATVTLPGLCRAVIAEFGRREADALPMTEPERACFASLPFAMNAVRLARWSQAVANETASETGLERELPGLYRIAERSVCNDGFGWGA